MAFAREAGQQSRLVSPMRKRVLITGCSSGIGRAACKRSKVTRS